jgi:hypothetical protein
MRTLIVPVLALSAVTFVACGKSDRSQLSHDVHAVASDLKTDAHHLATSADVKKAGDDVKHVAAQAGHDLKATGHEAANAVRHTGDEAKRAVNKS